MKLGTFSNKSSNHFNIQNPTMKLLKKLWPSDFENYEMNSYQISICIQKLTIGTHTNWTHIFHTKRYNIYVNGKRIKNWGMYEQTREQQQSKILLKLIKFSQICSHLPQYPITIKRYSTKHKTIFNLHFKRCNYVRTKCKCIMTNNMMWKKQVGPTRFKDIRFV